VIRLHLHPAVRISCSGSLFPGVSWPSSFPEPCFTADQRSKPAVYWQVPARSDLSPVDKPRGRTSLATDRHATSAPTDDVITESVSGSELEDDVYKPERNPDIVLNGKHRDQNKITN